MVLIPHLGLAPKACVCAPPAGMDRRQNATAICSRPICVCVVLSLYTLLWRNDGFLSSLVHRAGARRTVIEIGLGYFIDTARRAWITHQTRVASNIYWILGAVVCLRASECEFVFSYLWYQACQSLIMPAHNGIRQIAPRELWWAAPVNVKGGGWCSCLPLSAACLCTYCVENRPDSRMNNA